MNKLKGSAYAIVYLDEEFFFKDKRHNVPALLKLGFLLCKHYSPEDQELEMWHLINPKLADTVTKDQVNTFLTSLCYIAVDMNISK
jgi:hypothetical protein